VAGCVEIEAEFSAAESDLLVFLVFRSLPVDQSTLRYINIFNRKESFSDVK
jgi:hypothetical protein